jgi:hypothetical protein
MDPLLEHQRLITRRQFFWTDRVRYWQRGAGVAFE